MTIEEGISRIQELFSIEQGLTQFLEEFKEICQDSPLSNAEEDFKIDQYDRNIEALKTIHFNVIGSYLDWIIAARAP